MKLLQLDRTMNPPMIKEVEVETGGSSQPTTESKSIPLFISGNFIQAGDSVTLFMPNGARIDGVVLHTDATATIEVDLRATSNTALPSDATDSLCGENKPLLSAESFYADGNLLGWERAVNTGSVIVARVESVVGDVKSVTLQLYVAESAEGIPILLFAADPENADIANSAFVAIPAVEFTQTSSKSEYPAYSHAENVSVHIIDTTPLLVWFTQNSGKAEYPAYTHVEGIAVHVPDTTPLLVWFTQNSSVAEFPACQYPAYLTNIVFSAGADDSVSQWVKYYRTMMPTDGPDDKYTYSVSGLPAGLSYAKDENGACVISGVPEESGVFSVSVEVTDYLGNSVSDVFGLTVNSAIKTPVIETTLPTNIFILGDFTLQLLGYNFGTSGDVYANDVLLDSGNILSWEDSKIVVSLLPAATSPVLLRVEVSGVTSAAVSREILYL